MDDLKKNFEREISLLKSHYVSKDIDGGNAIKKKNIKENKVEKKNGVDMKVDEENKDDNKGEKSNTFLMIHY